MVCFNVTIETGIKTTKVVGQLKIFTKKESIYLLILFILTDLEINETVNISLPNFVGKEQNLPRTEKEFLHHLFTYLPHSIQVTVICPTLVVMVMMIIVIIMLVIVIMMIMVIIMVVVIVMIIMIAMVMVVITVMVMMMVITIVMIMMMVVLFYHEITP